MNCWTVKINHPQRSFQLESFEECEAALSQWLMDLMGSPGSLNFTGSIFHGEHMTHGFILDSDGTDATLDVWDAFTGNPI